MSTAQMIQTAPRLVHDIQPPAQAPMPAPTTQPDSSTEIEIVNDMPVKANAVPKSAGFTPVMSAEQHDRPSASDHVLHAASTAVHVQEEHAKAKSDAGPKPILETVLLIVGCLIACAIVTVLFSNN